MELSAILIVVLIALIVFTVTAFIISFLMYSQQKSKLSEIIKIKLDEEKNKKAVEKLLNETKYSSTIVRVKSSKIGNNGKRKSYSTYMNYKQCYGEFWIPELEIRKAEN